MTLCDNLRQDVITAIDTSLTGDLLYQRLRPDITPYLTATSNIPLKHLKAWERLIRHSLESSLYEANALSARFKHHQVGSLRWLDIVNSNGFSREKALMLLDKPAPNRFLLSLLMRRLNDWVPQVRNAAGEALLRVAAVSDPEIVVDALFVTLPNWNVWGRLTDLEKQIFIQVIQITAVTQALKNRLVSAAQGPVALIFSHTARAGVFDHCLLEFAQQSKQPSLRAKAYRAIFEAQLVAFEGTTWQWVDKSQGKRKRVPVFSVRNLAQCHSLSQHLDAAAHDRSPQVRRLAGEILIKEIEHIGDNAFALARLLAADKSPSVAERGRFALAELV